MMATPTATPTPLPPLPPTPNNNNNTNTAPTSTPISADKISRLIANTWDEDDHKEQRPAAEGEDDELIAVHATPPIPDPDPLYRESAWTRTLLHGCGWLTDYLRERETIRSQWIVMNKKWEMGNLKPGESLDMTQSPYTPQINSLMHNLEQSYLTRVSLALMADPNLYAKLSRVQATMRERLAKRQIGMLYDAVMIDQATENLTPTIPLEFTPIKTSTEKRSRRTSTRSSSKKKKGEDETDDEDDEDELEMEEDGEENPDGTKKRKRVSKGGDSGVKKTPKPKKSRPDAQPPAEGQPLPSGPQMYGSTPGRLHFPRWIVNILMQWLEANIEDPYPTEDQKLELMAKTGISLIQINNWFINNRMRKLKQIAAKQSKPLNIIKRAPGYGVMTKQKLYAGTAGITLQQQQQQQQQHVQVQAVQAAQAAAIVQQQYQQSLQQQQQQQLQSGMIPQGVPISGVALPNNMNVMSNPPMQNMHMPMQMSMGMPIQLPNLGIPDMNKSDEHKDNINLPMHFMPNVYPAVMIPEISHHDVSHDIGQSIMSPPLSEADMKSAIVAATKAVDVAKAAATASTPGNVISSQSSIGVMPPQSHPIPPISSSPMISSVSPPAPITIPPPRRRSDDSSPHKLKKHSESDSPKKSSPRRTRSRPNEPSSFSSLVEAAIVADTPTKDEIPMLPTIDNVLPMM